MIKKIFTVTILFSFLCISAISQTIITGTFNLRYDNPKDSGNLWKDRAPVAASLIRFHEFDIAGTQEGLRNQLTCKKAYLNMPGMALAEMMARPKANTSLSFTKKKNSMLLIAVISGFQHILRNPGLAGMREITVSVHG